MKQYIVPILILLMFAGLLWSRALLSMSMGAFVVYALLMHGREGLEEVKRSWWLKGMVMLFLIPLVSGLWSEDTKEWWLVMQVKLPLLLFPFCIGALMAMGYGLLKKLMWGLVGMVVVSMCLSLWGYIGMDNGEYLKAKVMKVAMYDDHVRYAWLVAISYLLLAYYLVTGLLRYKVIAVVVLIFFAVFIHLLAAKTGLMGFYMVNIIFAVTIVPKRYKLPALAGMILIPVMAWFTMPSFQNRMKFVWWDFQNYSRGGYVEGLSDAPRVLSWKAAVDIVKAHPLAGVGAGDIIPEVNKWYSVHAPFLKDYEKLVPANQVLLYGSYTGVAGGLLTLLIFLLPFTMPVLRRNPLWLGFHAVAFAGFMYEIALEMQFGAGMYALFSMLIYAQLKSKK